jgi:integrase
MLKGIRDGAVLAILLGAGLLRAELASLDFEHIQWRDGRWVIVGLAGKQGRTRSAPIPPWAHAASTRWKDVAGLVEGLFPEVSRATGASRRARSRLRRLHDCED